MRSLPLAPMTYLPVYRLLMAAAVLLTGAMGASRLGHTRSTDPCAGRSHIHACAIFQAPSNVAAPRLLKVEVVAAIGRAS